MTRLQPLHNLKMTDVTNGCYAQFTSQPIKRNENEIFDQHLGE